MSTKQPLLLLVALLVLVCWGAHLAVTTPYHCYPSYLSFHVFPEQSMATMNQSCESSHGSDTITWSRALALDLESGETWRPIQLPLAVLTHRGDDGTAHWLAETGDVDIWDIKHAIDIRWVVTELRTGRTLKSVPYQLEAARDRIVYKDRFLITKRDNSLEVIDLDADEPAPTNFVVNNPNRAIRALRRTDSIIVFGMASKPSQPLELFRIDDQGNVQSITSWTASSTDPALYSWPGEFEGEIATLSAGGDTIEVRNAADGQVTRNVSLPDDFDASKVEWTFRGRLFGYHKNKTLRVVNWSDEVTLPPIDSDEHWRHDYWRDIDPLLVARNTTDNGRRVIDGRTGEVIGTFLSSKGLSWYDQTRAFTSSENYGWTITEHDLASGQVAQRWRPFAYVIPSLIGWLVAYLAWCLWWISISAQRDWFAWIDVLLISGVAFGLLLLRAVVGGDQLNQERHVYQYAQGIAMAGAAVALAWLVFGRTRITLRVLPLIALSGVVAAILAWIFRGQPETAWFALATTFVPVYLLSIWLVALRLCKRTIRIDQENGTRITQTRYPLSDLFWITLLVSAGFAALSMISSGADVLLDFRVLHWTLLISQVVGIAAIIGALSRHRWWFWFSAVVVFVSIVYSAVEPIAKFAGDRLYHIYPLLPTNAPIRILMMFGVAAFVLLLPYRIRGYRLRYR